MDSQAFVGTSSALPWTLYGNQDSMYLGQDAARSDPSFMNGQYPQAGSSKQLERFHELNHSSTSRPSLRRAHSSSVLPNPTTPTYPFQEPLTASSSSTLPSPASDLIRTPRDGPLTATGASWFAAAQENYLSQQPHAVQPLPSDTYSQQPPTISPPTLYCPPSPTQRRNSPPAEDPRKRRHHSAQPEFTTTPNAPAPKYAANRHLTIEVPPSPYSGPVSQQMMAVPSREEVDQFLNEMSTMLGPEAMAAVLSPTTAPSQNPLLNEPAFFSPPTQAAQPPSNPPAVYNVSGVLLDDEDMAFLHEHSQSPSPAPVHHYLPTTPPASAPAYRTSFGMQPQYSQPGYNDWSGPSTAPLMKPQEYNNPAMYLSPPGQHQMGSYQDQQYRPRSVPSTPEQQAASAPLRRRVSAMDLPPRSGPPSHYAIPSPSPSPTLRRASVPPKAAPAARRPSGGRGKKAGGGISFINYTSSDSNTLLNGVAPSGSSKRKREEDEEADRKRKLSK